METRPLSFFAEACEGELHRVHPGTPIHRVTTDSRGANPGDLFIALKGERFDGHDFLDSAGRQGIACAVVARDQLFRVPVNMPVMVVKDPRSAYALLAARYRKEFKIPVVCVAGSNGKTTTKELLASILSTTFKTARSEASFNNYVGVPASLLKLEGTHQAAVFEAGTNHPGELTPLVNLIQPRIGVITSIGREHLEFFGDLAGVAAEEGSLAEHLPPAQEGGVLVLNGECPFAQHMALRTSAQVIKVGFSPSNDWFAEIESMDWSGTVFRVHSPDPAWNGSWRIALPGRHSVPNTLLGLAVSQQLGVEPNAARDGLASFRPAKQRLDARMIGGVRILDDTYNANADSVVAALQTLHDLPCPGRRVAVLGDMAELGTQTVSAHREIGRTAVRLGIDAIFAVGSQGHEIVVGAASDRARTHRNPADASDALLAYVRPGDSVLVKASRSSHLEEVVHALASGLTGHGVEKPRAQSEFGGYLPGSRAVLNPNNFGSERTAALLA